MQNYGEQGRAVNLPPSGTQDVDVVGNTVGLATEVTVAKRFAGAKLQRAVQISATGDNTIVTPAAGQRIRLLWLGLSSSENNGAEVLAIVKFGAVEHYRWNMGAPGAFAHWEIIEGATDEPLVINLSGSQDVEVNYTYVEFA